jgi:hypothetical protein
MEVRMDQVQREQQIAEGIVEVYRRAEEWARRYIEGALEAEDDFAALTKCQRGADFEMYLGEVLKDL